MTSREKAARLRAAGWDSVFVFGVNLWRDPLATWAPRVTTDKAFEVLVSREAKEERAI